MSVPTALGLDPIIANSVHRVINDGLGSILPTGLQKVALEGIFTIGRSQLSPFILNERNPLGSLRLSRLRRIFDEGKTLQLQFPAEDLGFFYCEGALVAGQGHKPQETGVSDHKRRRSMDNVLTAQTGSRLPHMQVRALESSDTFSTLDLIPGDRLEFVLIIAPVEESYTLARATLEVAQKFGLPLKVGIIWPQGSSGKHVKGSGVILEPWKNYIDVEEVKKPSQKSWWHMCHMTSKGAILVRPDEHIAWRVDSDHVKDIVGEIDRVFSLILGVKEHKCSI